MSGCTLRDLTVWFGLHGVNQVGKLYSILDEEDRDIVSDNVEIPLVSITKVS